MKKNTLHNYNFQLKDWRNLPLNRGFILFPYSLLLRVYTTKRKEDTLVEGSYQNLNERLDFDVNDYKVNSKSFTFDISLDIDRIYFNNDYEYFKEEILHHKDFQFNHIYIILIKLKTVSGNYYTITKKQIFVQTQVSSISSQGFLEKLWYKFHNLLEYYLDTYLKVIEEKVQLINIEFYSLKELNKSTSNIDYPVNLHSLSEDKKIISKEFDFFGGLSNFDSYLQDYNQNVLAGKYRLIL